MAGRGFALDRGCAHVARAIADAPAWAACVLLLLAPLPCRDLWWLHGRGLSAGLAALGGAILAKRTLERHGACDAGASAPLHVPFLDPERLLSPRVE